MPIYSIVTAFLFIGEATNESIYFSPWLCSNAVIKTLSNWSLNTLLILVIYMWGSHSFERGDIFAAYWGNFFCITKDDDWVWLNVFFLYPMLLCLLSHSHSIVASVFRSISALFLGYWGFRLRRIAIFVLYLRILFLFALTLCSGEYFRHMAWTVEIFIVRCARYFARGFQLLWCKCIFSPSPFPM